MTVPEAYAYLQRPRKLQMEIKKLMLKRDALRDCLLPAGIRYDLDKVDSSPSDRMSTLEAEIMDITKEIGQLTEQRLRLIKEIGIDVAKLNNDTEQIVLLGYYIGGHSMKTISEIIHYTVRGANKVKQRAVHHLAESVPYVPIHM